MAQKVLVEGPELERLFEVGSEEGEEPGMQIKDLNCE